jgi:nucleotide-binding universal stress UspA family protein
MSWLPKNKVLVPIDFSAESTVAVNTALEMVEDPSHIHVVHVLVDIAVMEPGVVWDTVNDQTRREQTQTSIRDRFGDDKFRGLKIAVVCGDPGTQIAAHAEQIEANLIVLPSHGRTGLKRLLIGSVAERVCRLAHCPVLVLRS